ncbi:MAG: hypothetical protein IJZ08_02485 [Clostridia bacterium]|nr:hypothetical protein [Clostridia bacterium]
MTKTVYDSPFAAACAALPAHIRDAVCTLSGLYSGKCSEIRLTRGGYAYITVQGKNILTTSLCTDADISETLRSLCGNSLYAHAETIREGFIFTDSGLRVGVCGRAVVRGGLVERVADISSLSIRIPQRHVSAADALYPYVLSEKGIRGMLIRSAPGVGKTTALRELAARLSSGKHPLRTALIDTRYELAAGLKGGMIDVFSGYPRAVGMEIAVRTMSPQVVICDEIAGEADARAVLDCVTSGVAVVASAHGESLNEILKRQYLRQLVDAGVFPVMVGLYRSDGHVLHRITNAAGETLPCQE